MDAEKAARVAANIIHKVFELDFIQAATIYTAQADKNYDVIIHALDKIIEHCTTLKDIMLKNS